MDDADRAAEYQERLIQHGLAQRTERRGPDTCLACGGWNDEADEGYAVCTACPPAA
jgi:hypothetical protein